MTHQLRRVGEDHLPPVTRGIMNRRANATALHHHNLVRAGVYRRYVAQHGDLGIANPAARRRALQEVRHRIDAARYARLTSTMSARLP